LEAIQDVDGGYRIAAELASAWVRSAMRSADAKLN
jgi:hypothetical protein